MAAFADKKTENQQSWRDVYVFISSTFNDMHPERNYLVKRVFPELSEWCASYHLRLRDIDLRWGITEEDSTINRRTVQICLDNIDRCRPFFLCFIGQRRGWVPSDKDIAEETFSEFPKLKDNLGRSVTEMEIIHSLIDPMRNGNVFEEDRLTRAFFYLRDPGYLEDISREEIRRIYTNTGSLDQARDDGELNDFREHILPGTGRPCRTYTCRWDENGTTSELGAVHGASPDITRGTLTDFMCGDENLSDRIIADMKAAITERYGLKEPDGTRSGLQQEIDAQTQFLNEAAESFLERPGDLEPFEEYINDDTQAPLIVTGGAGSGKTSLIAHWITTSRYQIYYRFVGRSLKANNPAELIYSIWEQMQSEGRVNATAPENTAELMERFSGMLGEAARHDGIILVIDAIDQFPGGVWDAAFLPHQLPKGVKLIISVKKDAPDAEKYLLDAAPYAHIIQVRPFDGMKDRAELAESFLSNYLKQLDRKQMDKLIESPGSENPLYLKVVLNELRVFGEYDTLTRHISEDFGSSAISAFTAMLVRLEGDADCDGIPMKKLVPKVFGWISHSQLGFSAEELAGLLVMAGIVEDEGLARGAVLLLERQLRPFLTRREQRIDFFYDSFREACINRYTAAVPPETWHGEIAAFLQSRPVDDRHRLAELAWQYHMAKNEKAYMATAFDYSYLSGKLEAYGVQSVISDYNLSDNQDAQRMVSFLGIAGRIITEYPDQLEARLFGHLCRLESPYIKGLLESAGNGKKGSWLKPVMECFEVPDTEKSQSFGYAKMELTGAVLLGEDKLAAAVVDRKTICIWEVETGKVRTRIATSEEGAFFGRLAATPDGEKLIAYFERNRNSKTESQIIVYETHGFTSVLSFSAGNFHPVYKRYTDTYFEYPAIEVSADGKAIFIMDVEGKLQVYDVNTGSLIGSADDERSIYRLHFSKEGLIAAAHIHPQNQHPDYYRTTFKPCENPAYLFRVDPDRATLKLEKQIGGWHSTVNNIALSPDGKYLAGSEIKAADEVLVYDTDTGEQLAKLKESKVTAIRFIEGRKQLLIIGERIAIYSLPDFKNVWSRSGLGYAGAVCVTGDGKNVLLNLVNRKCMRLMPLLSKDKETRANAAPMGIRSIARIRNGYRILASAYSNWLPYDREAVPGIDKKPSLFVFGHDGEYLDYQSLPERNYCDFIYLTPDGRGAVSKNFQDRGQFIFKCWHPSVYSQEDGKFGLPEFWLVPRRHIPSFGGHPQDIRFSSDRKYVILVDNGPKELILHVYGARDGRKIGTVKPYFGQGGLHKLFAAKTEDDYIDTSYAAMDISADGRELYFLFTDHDHHRIDRYIIKSGKRISSLPLTGDFKASSVSNYENQLCSLSDDGKRLVYVDKEQILLVETESGHVAARLGRLDIGCGSDDYFASATPDGRYLAVSGRRTYMDTDWNLQVWDLEKKLCLGRFVADGRISEILYEPEEETWLFGMENGRLCRLAVEEGNA